MDDDLIVVDDVEAMEQAGPSTVTHSQSKSFLSSEASARPVNVAEYSMASSGRSTRSSSNPPMQRSTEASDRTTRSATAKYKPQPKLKLKLSDKAAAQAPGMSFLGQYDRELDSDDEDLAFEEQFILRMPPGEDLEKLRKMVAAREVTNDIWFKFKGVSKALDLSPFFMFYVDSRRAIFHIGNSTYSAKLVDLPCIVESQKTLDHKQMFKVSDICQVVHFSRRRCYHF
jgi:transcription initiation factor TFIID subunit 7